ncbi:MAG TPA: hypothetical protein VGK29_05625 [Paludibaculum sp.]|jgi:hypothetical protein
MTRNTLVLCILSTIALSACHAKEETPQPAPAAVAVRAAYLSAASPEADDAARFLAGLPGRESSPWKKLEADPAWVEHAANMDHLWALYQDKRRPGMEKFSKSELTGTPFAGAKIWYPFSGGDALTMLTFFPGHGDYAMSALEPPGRVPSPSEFEGGQMAEHLPAIAGTLASLLSKSFFVTREMDRQLRGQVTDGVAQPILILLTRLGYKVLSHTYVQIGDDGKLARRTLEAKRAAFGLNRGIVFEIQRKDGPVEVLEYTSLNLDDSHMKDNSTYKKYVALLGRPATMLKATSYMLHSKEFTIIRDLILEQSAVIVQDDSGIPWKGFAPETWQVQLYGDYTKPFGKDFAFRTQPDLRAAYEAQRASVRPLDFRMGYGAGRQTSNLQIARRK